MTRTAEVPVAHSDKMRLWSDKRMDLFESTEMRSTWTPSRWIGGAYSDNLEPSGLIIITPDTHLHSQLTQLRKSSLNLSPYPPGFLQICQSAFCDTCTLLYLVRLQDRVYVKKSRFTDLLSVLEDGIGGSFTDEDREISVRPFLADVLDPDINQLEAADIV
jgi:hypothetical protein